MSSDAPRLSRPVRLSFDKLPYLWSGAGALILWVTIGILAQRGMVATLQGALQTGAIVVLVGIGQLLVVSSGSGNIDLSIPNAMTLGSLVALRVAEGDNGRIILGVLAALLVGLVVGLINSFVVFVLGIPAIVATMAVGLLLQSAILTQATAGSVAAPSSFGALASGRLLGLPNLTIIALLVSIAYAIALQRGSYGRRLFSLGQSVRATERSGLPTVLTATSAFVFSGMLACFAGTLLAAFTGPSISLGAPYLMTSVAVVVLGGTLIQGGRATVLGLWTAMLMLSFIITLVYVLQWSVAIQSIFQGLVILLVLSFSGKAKGR